MIITSSNSMQLIEIQKTHSSGNNIGGMRDIMQSLSTEDKNKMIEQLSLMHKEERSKIVAQMKDIDASSLNEQEYSQALLDMLKKPDTNDLQSEGFSVYA